MKVEVQIPDVAQVVVTGPTQCGKSIVADRIRRLLADEFGAELIVTDPDRAAGPGECSEWERNMIRKTTWLIAEHNQTRPKSPEGAISWHSFNICPKCGDAFGHQKACFCRSDYESKPMGE